MLVQLSLNGQTWPIFASFFTARGADAPPPPPEAVFIGLHTDTAIELLAGVCLYHAGHMLLAEHLATNPEASPRLRYAAVSEGITVIAGHAQSRGLTLIMSAHGKGLVRMLSEQGFSTLKSVSMVLLTSQRWRALKGEVAPSAAGTAKRATSVQHGPRRAPSKPQAKKRVK